MTEKRFECEEDSDYIRDNKTDERGLYLCEWLKELNDLSDENEQLKEQLSEQAIQLDYLIPENKHMKDVINENKQARKRIRELEKENMELKKQLDDNLQFLIRASQRLKFKSLDHFLYTLDKGEIYGYSTKNWTGDVE